MNEMSYSNITTNDPQAADKKDNYVIKTTLTGEFAKLRDFVNNLNGSPRIMKVDNIELSSTKVDKVYQNGMTLKNFFMPKTKFSGNLEDPVPTLGSGDYDLLGKITQWTQSLALISSNSSILSNLALSVFNILPLSGNIACDFLSLPCFALPPALSPSTIYISE